MGNKSKKKTALEEQYAGSKELTVNLSHWEEKDSKEETLLDLVAPETSEDKRLGRLSSKAAQGIAWYLLGTPWKEAAKRCGMSVAGLQTARWSEPGRELAAAHYIEVTKWTMHQHTRALQVVTNEFSNPDPQMRLKAADILLRHVNTGKNDADPSRNSNNASDIAKLIVENLNIQINVLADNDNNNPKEIN